MTPIVPGTICHHASGPTCRVRWIGMGGRLIYEMWLDTGKWGHIGQCSIDQLRKWAARIDPVPSRGTPGEGPR